MTIKKKIGVFVGSLLVCMALLTAWFYLQMSRIHDQLLTLIDEEEIQSAASYEMEINVIGTGFAVLAYLHDRQGQHIERIRDDESDFRLAVETYGRVARTHREKEIGLNSAIDRFYNVFNSLAWEHVRIEDRRTENMTALVKILDQVEEFLIDNIQAMVRPGDGRAVEKLRKAAAMESHINGMIKRLAGYLMTHKPDRLSRLNDHQDGFAQQMAEYGALPLSAEERAWLGDLNVLFDQTRSLVSRIIELHQEQATKLQTFVELRGRIDDLLDETIQPHARAEFDQAKTYTLLVMQRTRLILVVLSLIALAAAVVSWLYLYKKVVTPINQFVEATKQVAGGDFSTLLKVGAQDELGQLSAHFNTMITERGRAREAERQIRRELEHRVEHRTRDLSLAKEALESQVAQYARSQAALQQSEAMFRTLAETAPVGIFLEDMQGKLTYANPKCSELVGLPQEDILQGDWQQNIHPEDRARVRGAWAGTLTQRRLFHQEYRWVHPSGRQVVTLGIIAPVVSSDNKVNLFTGSLVDLTEQKRLENAQEDLREQLHQAQKLESIGRLAGGIAHDFNNMLSIILGYTELLMDEVLPGQSHQGYLKNIRHAAMHSKELTSRLLAFSRKQILNVETIDLNAVLRNLEKLLRRIIGENIALHLKLDHDLGYVRADADQLQQVIMNLVVNARDAMPQGGRLVIESANTTLDDASAREYDALSPGEYVMIAVSDTGEGMDRGTRSKIFEPFFTTKGVGKGTGLGLPMAYGIVKQSSGGISCQSEPGKGTRFLIHLPRVQAEELVSDEEKDQPQSRLPEGMHVLVVEDEAAVRMLMQEMLTGLGCRVSLAPSGEEALQMIQSEHLRPDLVITDVIMPGMSGRDLLEQLHALQPQLRTLYMSGYTDDAITQQGLEAGDTVILKKPFTRQELFEAICVVMPQEP